MARIPKPADVVTLKSRSKEALKGAYGVIAPSQGNVIMVIRPNSFAIEPMLLETPPSNTFDLIRRVLYPGLTQETYDAKVKKLVLGCIKEGTVYAMFLDLRDKRYEKNRVRISPRAGYCQQDSVLAPCILYLIKPNGNMGSLTPAILSNNFTLRRGLPLDVD